MSIVNRVLCALKLQKYVDARTLSRISGVCLDFLVVAAVSSIRLDVIVDHAMSMLLISIAALASMLFYFYWLAPRVFSEDWFEQAIVHFGVNTGVTAVGFMLLRVVDPDLETLGSKAYAIQAPFTSPLFGGDIVTALIPMAIATYGNVKVALSRSPSSLPAFSSPCCWAAGTSPTEPTKIRSDPRPTIEKKNFYNES